MTWRCFAARRMCRWQYATPGALQQLARATNVLGPADINVLCVSSEMPHSPRAPEPASASHAAPRQRSWANAGRTRVLCNQTRLQWPGGRPCIGTSRLRQHGSAYSSYSTTATATKPPGRPAPGRPSIIRRPAKISTDVRCDNPLVRSANPRDFRTCDTRLKPSPNAERRGIAPPPKETSSPPKSCQNRATREHSPSGSDETD